MTVPLTYLLVIRIPCLHVSIVNIFKKLKSLNLKKKVVIMPLYDGVYIPVVYYVNMDEFIGRKHDSRIILFTGYKYIIAVF